MTTNIIFTNTMFAGDWNDVIDLENERRENIKKVVLHEGNKDNNESPIPKSDYAKALKTGLEINARKL